MERPWRASLRKWPFIPQEGEEFGHMQVWGRECWSAGWLEEGGGRHEFGEVDRMRLSKILLAP